MVGYYFRNTDGTIQSRSKQVDNTWFPLSDLETKEDGSYYEFYNLDGTPDLVKIAEVEATAQAQEAKQAKLEALATLTVTTTAGNEFDGDETSQTRMTRAISVMGDTDSITWVLANNISTMVSKAELMEALKLSGEAQTALWTAQ